jgi:hypothetical protein
MTDEVPSLWPPVPTQAGGQPSPGSQRQLQHKSDIEDAVRIGCESIGRKFDQDEIQLVARLKEAWFDTAGALISLTAVQPRT